LRNDNKTFILSLGKSTIIPDSVESSQRASKQGRGEMRLDLVLKFAVCRRCDIKLMNRHNSFKCH